MQHAKTGGELLPAQPLRDAKRDRRNCGAKPPKQDRVWFDDVVIATAYIGPIRPR